MFRVGDSRERVRVREWSIEKSQIEFDLENCPDQFIDQRHIDAAFFEQPGEMLGIGSTGHLHVHTGIDCRISGFLVVGGQTVDRQLFD